MKIEFLETIKVVDGLASNLEYHQRRYEAVLNSYGIKQFAELSTLIDAPKEGLYRCRLVYDLKGNIACSYHPYVKRKIASLKLITADKLEYSKKYADREALDALFAKRSGCDDVLIVKNGLLYDTTIANIALFDGKKWVTPKKPLLTGTTRERLLESGFLTPKDISVSDLKEYTQIAVMNAMIDFDIIADKKIEEIIC
ncbi:MAG: aminotransferase class IV [Epsilonproteobacteria bacterium]|nr:aminotransferase class IV [Campylobacterota bacterium]